jgi:cytoskeletal protein RodZ
MEALLTFLGIIILQGVLVWMDAQKKKKSGNQPQNKQPAPRPVVTRSQQPVQNPFKSEPKKQKTGKTKKVQPVTEFDAFEYPRRPTAVVVAPELTLQDSAPNRAKIEMPETFSQWQRAIVLQEVLGPCKARHTKQPRH